MFRLTTVALTVGKDPPRELEVGMSLPTPPTLPKIVVIYNYTMCPCLLSPTALEPQHPCLELQFASTSPSSLPWLPQHPQPPPRLPALSRWLPPPSDPLLCLPSLFLAFRSAPLSSADLPHTPILFRSASPIPHFALCF